MKLSSKSMERPASLRRRSIYAELRGQVTAPASKNTPARPGPRHNGSIGIIVQGQLRQVLVADKTVPFVVQRGDDLGSGRVQQATGSRLSLKDAGGIQIGEGPLVALTRLLVGARAGNGRGQRVAGPGQHADPLGPRRAPVAQLVGVGGPGPQPIPPAMAETPDRIHAVRAG